MKTIIYRAARIFSIALIILSLSCSKPIDDGPSVEAENTLRAMRDIGFYAGSDCLVGFDENTQIYLRQDAAGGRLFRIQSDCLTKYATAGFEAKESYSVGTILNVAITGVGYDQMPEEQMAMKIVRIENGLVWMIENRAVESPLGIVSLWE